MLCVQIYCELCVFGLLSDELSTVNTGLGRYVLETSVSFEYS